MTTTYLPMWNAQQIIRMHQPEAVVATVRDRYAQWRDIAIARDDREPTTYRRSRCGQCRDDGCRLLEAAKHFQAVVSPYLGPSPLHRRADTDKQRGGNHSGQ